MYLTNSKSIVVLCYFRQRSEIYLKILLNIKMHLTEAIKRLEKNLKTYNTEKGTVFRVFEIYQNMKFDESGNEPIFIKPEEVEKKKKSRIN